ncbi:MAG: CHAT domain-containing protein, partial [Pseudonocardiaceae bacterium]
MADGETGLADGLASSDGASLGPVRVFVSYAHDDAEHEDRVREFWIFLRAHGIDARLDKPAAQRRQDWPLWMLREVREARFVLVVASPAYRQRAEGEAPAGEGLGVQWEAALIREEVYSDREAALNRFLPVVLPGCAQRDIPVWLGRGTSTHYVVSDYTVPGAETLLRLLTAQPYEFEPPLGKPPVLAPRGAADPPTRPGLRTELLIHATGDGAGLVVDVTLAGTPLCRRESTLPHELRTVWESLRAGPLVAAARMLSAGRQLAEAVFDERSQHLVAEVVDRLPPGDWVDVVWAGDGPALGLPVELLRLTTAAGEDLGPLALRAGVTVLRRVAGAPRIEPIPAPGPVKILAAVAAPDESLTGNRPLDTEAEMQAVLDAVTDVAGDPRAQVQILEVASVQQIVAALRADAYHVLHLSAHGSPDSVELEDEDGGPVSVDTTQLIEALRDAGRPVPLIVLSSCSGGASGAEALAAGLVRRGAGRVVAMQAPVTDRYAIALAASFYRELVEDPAQPVRQALTRARRAAEHRLSATRRDTEAPLPEYGVPTLLTAHADTPLLDIAAPPQSLTRVTVVPAGTSVRELAVGALIGRRTQLRAATAVLRRTTAARDRWGAAAGVQLVGVGGIGKTAIAGRVMTRLRADGWVVAVHEGRWDPTALISATAGALTPIPALADVAAHLRNPAVDDLDKLDLVRRVLATQRLLVVFDDFEQNLSRPGGEAFLDATVEDAITALCNSAEVGAVLVTCRYPLPGPQDLLVEIPVPSLSPSELARLFLRLPALRDLDPEDRRLLHRTVGGHPRLIEFVDALLRGGRANLRQVQAKLRDLARREGIDITRPRPLGQAVDQAMLLGSADILLDELLDLLTPRQRALLDQVAVSRAPMRLDDLAYVLADDSPSTADLSDLDADVDRLVDLTLLSTDPGIGMHPWTAELLEKRATSLTHQHQRALAMRMRRFSEGVAGYLDLLDVPRHLAALGRYDNLAAVAEQATQVLPGTLAVAAFLAEVRPLIPPTEHAWVRVSKLEMETFLAAGDIPSATRLAEDLHHHAEARAATDLTNTTWQQDVAVIDIDLGDLAQAIGDLRAAERHYRAALTIDERLIAADSSDAFSQRHLSVSHDRLGNLAVTVGEFTTAHDHYQTALTIDERLATTDPTNTAWQRDLSISHDRLGNLAVAAGDLTTAHDHYQTALTIRERLATIDPTNTAWQRDLSISHSKL